MNYTYILYSTSADRYYIGKCSTTISERIKKHNEKKYGGKAYTSMASDWTLYLALECENDAHAARLERKIKSMKSRKYLENLKQYPEMREKLVAATRTI